MAILEAVAGLQLNAQVADIGTAVAAELGFSADATGANLQVLELNAALGVSAGLVGQRGNQNLIVSPALIEGELTDADDRIQDVNAYRVAGLASPILEGRRYEALTAPGVPLDGAAHPDPGMPGIFVIRRTVRFEEGDQTRAIVTVTWGVPTADDLNKGGGASGGGMLSLAPASYTESVWKDRNGDNMIVQYDAGIFRASRVVEAELQKKTWTATLTKEFSAPQYADMKRPSAINSHVFGPFPARTLLYLGPTINETDEGKYSHGYQFTYNPDTWKLRASIWISGAIPDDATTNYNPPSEPGGLGEFFINEEFDFATFPVWFP